MGRGRIAGRRSWRRCRVHRNRSARCCCFSVGLRGIGGLVLGLLARVFVDAADGRARTKGLAELQRQHEVENRRLSRQESRLLSARSTVEEDALADAKPTALTLLDDKLAIRRRERVLLTVRLWHVSFERWTNCLGPILENLESLRWEEIDRRRALLEHFLDVGQREIGTWRTHEAAKSEVAAAFFERVDSLASEIAEVRSNLALLKGTLADKTASEISRGEHLDNPLFSGLRERITAGKRLLLEEINDQMTQLEAEREVEDHLRLPSA